MIRLLPLMGAPLLYCFSFVQPVLQDSVFLSEATPGLGKDVADNAKPRTTKCTIPSARAVVVFSGF